MGSSEISGLGSLKEIELVVDAFRDNMSDPRLVQKSEHVVSKIAKATRDGESLS